MKRVTVAPSLVLDDEMFELALVGLREHAPEQVDNFTWKRFVDRESWVLVPDVEHPENPFYKAEYVVKHGAPYIQTVKLNYWVSPDLRKDGAPVPHNHPWPFRGVLLKGGYTEHRYEVKLNRKGILDDPYSKWNVGGTDLTQVTHVAGDVNDIQLRTFHEVTEILEPGTLSLMDCGLGRKEGWGHLEDDGNGELIYVPNKMGELDTRFMPLLLSRNPHLRKRK